MGSLREQRYRTWRLALVGERDVKLGNATRGGSMHIDPNGV